MMTGDLFDAFMNQKFPHGIGGGHGGSYSEDDLATAYRAGHADAHQIHQCPAPAADETGAHMGIRLRVRTKGESLLLLDTDSDLLHLTTLLAANAEYGRYVKQFDTEDLSIEAAAVMLSDAPYQDE